MKIFILNCGSSSFKYQLLDMDTQAVLAKGLAEKLGLEGAFLTYQKEGGEKITFEMPKANHEMAIKKTLEALVDGTNGAIKALTEINGVGHRVVHGGQKFTASALITPDVLKAIKDCVPLAPLHNPANIVGIEAMNAVLPNVKNVAVFDTAFHQTMPEEAFLYAIPYEYYEKNEVRRYGFHGTSHRFVAAEAAKFLGIDPSKFNAISCHMGNGSSLCAIQNGKSIDTTMGLTPLEGMVMGTRAGDMDPAVPLFLQKNCGLSADQVDDILNKKSGLLGVSGVSSDMREVEDEAAKGNKRAQLSIDMLERRTIKFIGAYAALLGRVDAIIFTAGIGENAIGLRKDIMNKLSALGIKADEAANNVRGKETIISSSDSKIKVVLMPTNEELMIAKDTLALIK